MEGAFGAVEGSRTPTSKWTLDPEPSASTNSATTAFGGFDVTLME